MEKCEKLQGRYIEKRINPVSKTIEKCGKTIHNGYGHCMKNVRDDSHGKDFLPDGQECLRQGFCI